MTLNFVIPEMNIGGAGTPPLQFYRRGFILNGSGGSSPTWKDIILHGDTALTLVNSKADGLNYLKLFGGCEQNGTPTPTVPVDIVCNNGTLTIVDDELPDGYKRVLGYTCDNNVLWQITGFKLMGSDTVRISFSVNGACNVFGCYQGTDATDNYDLYVSTLSDSKYLRYGGGTYLSYWSSSNLGKRFDVVFSSTGTSGMPQDSTWTPLTFESANDLLIGSTTLTGTSSKLKGNLYGNFEVDNRLKLIPCERVSDGSLGYYDTYSETFFEPTGTPTSLGYDGSHYVLDINGTTETVEITGKNLFDIDSCIANNYTTSEGTINTSVNWMCSDFIPVLPNTGYVFTVDTTSGSAAKHCFYSQAQTGSFISYINSGSQTFTTPPNARYMRISVRKESEQAQLEIGSTATTYEQYYNGGTATAEMLLSLPTKGGDSIYAQDTQNVTTGEVTRNVGIKVFDGTETWNRGSNQDASGNYVFYMSLTDRKIQDTAQGLLCSHFKFRGTVSYSTMLQDEFCINQTIQYIYFDGGTRTTIDEWKVYLASQYANGTPVIVVYPLATPTTETVTPQSLTIQAGTNTVEITQASMDNLELEVSYKAGVTVTVEEVEDAQLSKSVEVTING